MVFQNMVIDLDGTVSGSGNDNFGDFTIEGKINDGWLEFKKQYETYPVNYRGQCTDNSGVFNGTWEITDSGGIPDQHLFL